MKRQELDPSLLLTRREVIRLGAGGVAGLASASSAATASPEVETDQKRYDAVVVGGSFAGLSAAMQLARARRKVLLIDAGLPRNRFAKTSHGFLGQDGRTPREIVTEARRQLARYSTVRFLDGEVVSAEAVEGGFRLELADHSAELASRLVLATGVRDELPSIPGLQERWGASALHCPYCHGYEYGDRELGVMAKSPASLHAALLVPDWGPTTYFTQDLHEPNADEIRKLSARGVRIETSPIVEFLGQAPTLEAVRLQDGRVVPLEAIFVTPQTQPASSLAAQLGCAFEEGPTGPFLRVDERKLTSVKGVYAAGDAASAMPNATVASAAGVMAGAAAHQSLIFD